MGTCIMPMFWFVLNSIGPFVVWIYLQLHINHLSLFSPTAIYNIVSQRQISGRSDSDFSPASNVVPITVEPTQTLSNKGVCCQSNWEHTSRSLDHQPEREKEGGNERQIETVLLHKDRGFDVFGWHLFMKNIKTSRQGCGEVSFYVICKEKDVIHCNACTIHTELFKIRWFYENLISQSFNLKAPFYKSVIPSHFHTSIITSSKNPLPKKSSPCPVNVISYLMKRNIQDTISLTLFLYKIMPAEIF